MGGLRGREEEDGQGQEEEDGQGREIFHFVPIVAVCTAF